MPSSKKLSIFGDEKNRASSNWFKFEKIGDKVEGTYIGFRREPSNLPGKEGTYQNIYDILDENGTVWSIGGRANMDNKMRYVRLGQIVGFSFDGEKPPARKGFNPLKLIETWQNPKVVNEEWLAQNPSKRGVIGVETVGGFDDAPIDTEPTIEAIEEEDEETEPTPAPKAPPTFGSKSKKFEDDLNEDVLKEILEYAKDKMGAESDADAKKMVMESTGLAFLALNAEKIAKAIGLRG